MAEEKSKLIPFTKELEAAIEADARRCHRSFVRQVVAVLAAYYETNDVDLNQKQLQLVGEIMPRAKTSVAVIDTEKHAGGKKDHKKKKRA